MLLSTARTLSKLKTKREWYKQEKCITDVNFSLVLHAIQPSCQGDRMSGNVMPYEEFRGCLHERLEVLILL